MFFHFLIQNICCGNSKEPPQRDGSFEHPKHMLKLMGKKICTFYADFCFVYLNQCNSSINMPFYLKKIQPRKYQVSQSIVHEIKGVRALRGFFGPL